MEQELKDLKLEFEKLKKEIEVLKSKPEFHYHYHYAPAPIYPLYPNILPTWTCETSTGNLNNN